MTSILLRNGRVHTPADPDATAVMITDGLVSWIGGEHGLAAAGTADRVVDLDGLLVVPGFVDAHVHATDTGLSLVGVDLAGSADLADCLRLLRTAAATSGGLLWAHGWDETTWDVPVRPGTADLDAILGDRPAYVARRDVHSAAASTALRQLIPQLSALPGFHPEHPLTAAAHHAVRDLAKSLLTTDQRAAAQEAFLGHAAAHGIVEVHECGFDDPAGRADLASLLGRGPLRVRGYLGAAAGDADQARALLAATGAHALGGDLVVDGAIGSRTAALTADYADDSGNRGRRYLSDDEIRDHLVACALAGIQPGFHAIGDDGVAAVAAGMTRAAELLGGTVHLAAVTPRVEHVEMAGAEQVAALAAVGAVASMQPVFDELWGGADGMYERRLGSGRSGPMNPFAALALAGVPLAFGSDAPVTPVGPWRAVRAAVHHRTAGSVLSPRAAFVAHTRGGHRAAGRVDRGIGTVTVGAPADLALVRTGMLVRPAPDPTVARWSTDPRSRVPLLPDLTPGGDLPVNVATMVDGAVVFDPSGLLGDATVQSQ